MDNEVLLVKKNMKEKTKKGKNVTSTKNKKKKDSKGFTLIEIIGVIIIIGIIMIIGTVAVSGYIESSKARTYESYKKDLEGATENLMIECISGNEEGCDIPEYGRDIKISYNELVEKGYSDRLKDPEGEGYCDTSYVIAKNNSENGVELEYQVCLYCSNYKSEEAGCEELGGSDSVPPTCDYTQLVGASTEWTKENKVISIGCSDGESGCEKRIFSNSIGKEGEVIEKGTITIRDKAGNERECEVDAYVDKKAPSCRVEIEGTGENGWYRPGTKVRLVSTSDEGSGVVEYGMGSSLINKDYNGKEEYEVRNGIVTVFGYVKDEVGNEGYCSIEVKIDDTTPEGEVNMGYEIYPKEERMNVFNELIDNHYWKIYRPKADTGGKTNPMNLHPWSFQFYKCNPIMTFQCLIKDIDGTPQTEVAYFVSPESRRSEKYESIPMPSSLLKESEWSTLLSIANYENDIRPLLSHHISKEDFEQGNIRMKSTLLPFLDEKLRGYIPLRPIVSTRQKIHYHR